MKKVFVSLNDDNLLDNITLEKCSAVVENKGFNFSKHYNLWEHQGWLTVKQEQNLIKELQNAGILYGSLSNVLFITPKSYRHVADCYLRITKDLVFETRVGGS